MGATTKSLLEVKVVTDHDCGNYRIGEIDFGIHCGEVEDFLKQYGLEGRDDLIGKLAYLSHWVHAVYEKIPKPESTAHVYQTGRMGT